MYWLQLFCRSCFKLYVYEYTCMRYCHMISQNHLEPFITYCFSAKSCGVKCYRIGLFCVCV